MMRTYEDLGSKLKAIVGESRMVKFQPGPSVKLTYPCVLYELSNVSTIRADDKSYLNCRRYQVTHIYKSVDGDLIDKFLENFEYISYDNRQIVDGLYHDYFTIYY